MVLNKHAMLVKGARGTDKNCRIVYIHQTKNHDLLELIAFEIPPVAMTIVNQFHVNFCKRSFHVTFAMLIPSFTLTAPDSSLLSFLSSSFGGEPVSWFSSSDLDSGSGLGGEPLNRTRRDGDSCWDSGSSEDESLCLLEKGRDGRARSHIFDWVIDVRFKAKAR